MTLAKHLVRAGLVTGPTSALTRHTFLGMLLNHLCGGIPKAPVKGDKKQFHEFGTRLHEPFLVGKVTSKFTLLSKNDIRTITRMYSVLKEHPAVVEIMKQCPTREKTRKLTYDKVNYQFTPDAHGRKTVMDLKTTSCKKMVDFLDSAFEYGYFRQAYTYGKFLQLLKKLLKGCDHYIVGIGKKFPHKVFILHLNAHVDKMDYAAKEFEFLHYFYKNYGSFKPQSKNT